MKDIEKGHLIYRLKTKTECKIRRLGDWLPEKDHYLTLPPEWYKFSGE